MEIDTVMIVIAVLLSMTLAVGFLQLSRENPRPLGGIVNYHWDKYIEVFQPKRDYSILEDPLEDEK